MKLKTMIGAAGATILVALVAIVVFRSFPEDTQSEGKVVARPRIRSSPIRSGSSGGLRPADPRNAVRNAIAGRKLARTVADSKPGFEEFLDELSSDDRKIVLSVQDALDENNFSAVASAAQHALKSTNPAVREAAVEALGWFGPQALPNLTPLMADADDDVANTAIAQWELAMSDIEDDDLRLSIVEATMKTLDSVEALTSIVSEITSRDDDLEILESLVSIIESGNEAGARVAREEYEQLTGEEWTDIDAANRWLDENYTPPESDEDEESTL